MPRHSTPTPIVVLIVLLSAALFAFATWPH